MKQARRPDRAGQSLVEFALVALVLYMLLAAILTFGHALYVAQGLQGAADLAAREISRTPLPALSTFEEVMADGSLDEIYQEAFLVFDLTTLGDRSFFQDVVPNWPVLNQQLATLMIVDRPDFDGDGNPDAELIRYPGALLSDASTQTGFTVGIPLVTRDGSGTETIRWVEVVEEIQSDANPNPFSLMPPESDGITPLPGTSVPEPLRGIVALRINYPFQSASMSSFQPNVAGPFEPTIGSPNVANNSVSAPSPPNGTLIDQPLVSSGPNAIYAGTYGGTLGLGAQGAFGQVVRPFRRVITAQAIYRREVFQ